MSLLIRFLKIYYKTRWRGSFRLTDILAKRVESLQCVPIETDSGIVYGDLRISSSRGILAQPKSTSGEDIVMRNLVKSGDTVYDIGAHFGFYTLLLSKLVGENGKVYAFEPNPELLPSLKRTISSSKNIELIPVALSEENGSVKLFVPEDASMASLGDWTNGIAGNVHQVECEMRRLDDLTEEKKMPVPNFIKCDVEGAELSVFAGGIKMLDRVDAPILLFEINSGAAHAFDKTSESYFEFLRKLDKPQYIFFEVLPDRIEELKSSNVNYANILALPQIKQNLHREIVYKN